ncbi:hypothetical protein TMatcc_000427 [Talaromyces marneffei ATCC 18224]
MSHDDASHLVVTAYYSALPGLRNVRKRVLTLVEYLSFEPRKYMDALVLREVVSSTWNDTGT